MCFLLLISNILLHEKEAFTYTPCRIAPSKTGKISNMIDEIMQAKIIRKLNSNYVSLIVVIENGEKRFCVDYRKLNTSTVKDNSHLLPRICNQTDRLYGGKYFTSFNLTSGYY